MKTTLIHFLFTMLISVVFIGVPSVSVYAHDRSLSEMKLAALNVLNKEYSKQRCVSSLTITDLKELKRMDRLSIIGNENRGFAVVSHDDCQNAILGYSFTALSDTLPCGFEWWLTAANESLKSRTPKNIMLKNEASRVQANSVFPLLTTKWGQGNPYNNKLLYSINGVPVQFVSGCVATAMAQVMNFHQYPDKGKDSISYVVLNYMARMKHSFEESYYDWDLMSDEYDIWNSFSGSAEAVSTLIRDCGIAVESNYGTQSTSASSNKIASAMIKYFSYSSRTQLYERANYSDSRWMELIYNELSARRPIIYNGRDLRDPNNPSGHSFVLHGCDTDGRVFINWGWEGSYDGYYNLEMLNPNGDSEYNDEQDMVFVIPGNVTKVDPYSCKLRVTAEGNGKVYLENKANNYVRRSTKSFRIDKNSDVKLIICPDEGCRIGKVLKNGVDVSSNLNQVGSTKYEYYIKNLSYDTEIEVVFVKSTFKVTVLNSGIGGDVWVNDVKVVYKTSVEVEPGSDVSLTITPDDYVYKTYIIEKILVNNIDVTSDVVDGQYIIRNIQQDTEVRVSFTEKQHSDWIMTIDVKGNGEVVYYDQHIRNTTEDFPITYSFIGTYVRLQTTPDEGAVLDSVLVTKGGIEKDQTTKFKYFGWDGFYITSDIYMRVLFSGNKVGIDDMNNEDDIQIRLVPGGVTIDGIAEGNRINVFCIDGKLLKSVSACNKLTFIPLDYGDLYIIKIRDKVLKVKL